MAFLNRSCFLSLKDFELHFTHYPIGAFYRRHRDQFRARDQRKLSFLFYLNPDWQAADGGQLRLYLPGAQGLEKPKDILPEAGRFLCFRSDLLEHEVLPAQRTRLALTGWMLDALRFNGVGHLAE